MDLSNYLANRTSQHVYERLGGSQKLRGDAFDYDSEFPNQLLLPKHYRLTFQDQGHDVVLRIENNRGEMPESLDKLVKSKIGISNRDSAVLASVYLSREGNEVAITVSPRKKVSSAKRTGNEEKLFFAIYRSAIAPLLSSILEMNST